MELGAFSISLNVKDIALSKAFYENLGFEVIAGDQEQNWLILRNGDTTIGLFQGMFDSNIMTFNPGWDNNNQPIDSFTDVREILAQVKAQGVEITNDGITGDSGPSNFSLVDPDGNSILIDQHR